VCVPNGEGKENLFFWASTEDGLSSFIFSVKFQNKKCKKNKNKRVIMAF
jgi:hypothetical protein